MKKKLNYTIPLLFALVVAFGIFVGARFTKPGESGMRAAFETPLRDYIR